MAADDEGKVLFPCLYRMKQALRRTVSITGLPGPFDVPVSRGLFVAKSELFGRGCAFEIVKSPDVHTFSEELPSHFPLILVLIYPRFFL